MTFKENVAKVSDFLKGLINDKSSAETIAQVGEMNKALEELSRDHETALQEEQVAKDNLIKFVTNASTSERPSDLPGDHKSLDDILGEELAKIKD